MWSGLPQSLTLQLISIHVQKVHEHLICREGVIKGRCNPRFPQAWGGRAAPAGSVPPPHPLSPEPLLPSPLCTLAGGSGVERCSGFFAAGIGMRTPRRAPSSTGYGFPSKR